MKKEAIAIFDIGKTNKKFLLFDSSLKIIHEGEEIFEEILDDDGFPCDDVKRIELWMKNCLSQVLHQNIRIRAINFSTYGATLMYLDKSGSSLTPAYSYLKPLPDDVLTDFYEQYGGIKEFSRSTASPALGMLNSGLQILWLKRKKSELFKAVAEVMHFPQYLSYCFTGKVTSEYTSIGCHTAMWDFDKWSYHSWLTRENISLPLPISNSIVFDTTIEDKNIKIGIGIHDSSSSLVPYFKVSKEQFILISTGTWFVFMNPFNDELLTSEQLNNDCLCYLSVNQKQVKSSRLFLGHMHNVNLKRLNNHFGVDKDYYKTLKTDLILLSVLANEKERRIFFKDSIPDDYIDLSVDISQFKNFDEAYHVLIRDLANLAMRSLRLIIPADDKAQIVYISGGFAKNEIFVNLIAAWLPDKKVITSEVDNASALGAAIVVLENVFGRDEPVIELGLKECKNATAFSENTVANLTSN